MLYSLLKIPARLAIGIYCKKININKKELLQHKGPLLLACNHPNSFLDAIILDVLFNKPIYSLARGDSFNKNWASKILRQLNILPVYREREGTEHLHKNYDTFDACLNIFKQNGIVLIFSEALCVNEWHLRPLRKGTARLCMQAWQQNIPLQVLPVGLNYSNFDKFGKTIFANFGTIIEQQNITSYSELNGKSLNEVTNKIQLQLTNLVFEVDNGDAKTLQEKFAIKSVSLKKAILFIPAIIGYIFHFPFYFPLQKIVAKKATNTGHYDSIILGSCFLGYPFYLLLVALLINFFAGNFWWLLVLIMPILAWCWVQRKSTL